MKKEGSIKDPKHGCHPGGLLKYDLGGGRASETLKSGPVFIPNFAEKWDPFLYQSHKF